MKVIFNAKDERLNNKAVEERERERERERESNQNFPDGNRQDEKFLVFTKGFVMSMKLIGGEVERYNLVYCQILCTEDKKCRDGYNLVEKELESFHDLIMKLF